MFVEFGRTVVADGRFEQVFRTIGVVEPADKARTAHFRRAAVGELILESSGEQIRDGGRRETGPLRRDPAVVVVDQLVQQKSLQVVVLGESTFVIQRELGRQPLSLAGLLSQLFLEGERVSRPEKGLHKTVNRMHNKTRSELTRHHFPRQLRNLILQEYLSGRKTARQLEEEHGMSMATIHKMSQRWKAKNSCTFVSAPNPLPIMSRVTSEEADELLSENKALRHRLEEALLRLEGYEIMGDILQEEYGIDLLKKSVAGQSSVSKNDTHK